MLKKANILLITTDQQRYDTIARLGNDSIFTPHLDWLVSQGTSFDQCYSDCPICMPSRATIMTGRPAWQSGLTKNSTAVRPMEEFPTIPGILTHEAYQTKAVGKMHFYPERKNYGFESMEILQDYYREKRRQGKVKPMAHGVGQCESVPVFSTVPEEESLTSWTVERSVNFLETRDESRPFFLWTSFSKPHPPYDCDPKYWNLYEGMKFPKEVHGEWSKTADVVPDSLLASTYAVGGAHKYTKEKWQSVKRAYYSCITQIDYNLGTLFARMRELGLMENTYIIFTSDHGEMLGDHYLSSKSVFLEGSARLPFIIKRPSKEWQGKESELKNRRCDSLCTLADLLPTVLAMADIKDSNIQRDLPGRNLLEVNDPERDANLSEQKSTLIEGFCEDHIAIIGTRYKYLFEIKGGGELFFDRSADPSECKNIIQTQNSSELSVLEDFRNRAAALAIKAKRNELVKDGVLTSSGPALTEQEVLVERAWPGFHSEFEKVDILH